MGVPTPRTAVARGRSIDERLDILEARQAAGLPARLLNTGRGPTSERDIYFGVPGTDADRVDLANRRPTWFNTDLGWEEGYFATSGLTGLTAPGTLAGFAAGWYPLGGADIFVHKGMTGGFQQWAGGAAVEVIMPAAQIRRGGWTEPVANRVVVPHGGFYDLNVKGYFTGLSQVIAWQQVSLEVLRGGSSVWLAPRALVNNRAAGNDAQDTAGAFFSLMAGDVLHLVFNSSTTSNNTWGSNGWDGTFLEATYKAPPLAND